jgi:hypothetical protein
MNVFDFVLGIVIVTGIFSLLRHRMGIRSSRMGGCSQSEFTEKTEENDRLRSQVKQMQDRINILERIVTDRGVETAAQIEALRDRDRLGVEDKVK